MEPEDGLLVATFLYNNDYGVVVFFGPGTLPEVRAALERDLDRWDGRASRGPLS